MVPRAAWKIIASQEGLVSYKFNVNEKAYGHFEEKVLDKSCRHMLYRYTVVNGCVNVHTYVDIYVRVYVCYEYTYVDVLYHA